MRVVISDLITGTNPTSLSMKYVTGLVYQKYMEHEV